MLSFFPLDVLDEIWDLIESVSEGFLTYSSIFLRYYRSPGSLIFPLDVLDEIWDLIESVSEGFHTYSSIFLRYYRSPGSLIFPLDVLDEILRTQLSHFLRVFLPTLEVCDFGLSLFANTNCPL